MSDLPQTRFSPNPLFFLAGTLALGILLGHPATHLPMLVLLCAGAGFTVLAAGLIFRKHSALASGFLLAAFFCAGVVISLIDNQPAAADRVARLYDRGEIAAGDPVELTGVVEGEPEPAVDSYYLTLRVERIRLKGIERNASGQVLLLANARESQAREYDALELRHGARLRVMTALDREENFRNPGMSSFTEYLDRKGYDATGVIKSPLLVERLDDDRVFLPLAWVYEWRRHLQEEFSARLSAETAGVLDAALLGNRYRVSRSAGERFRAGGTFHVLVISGLQISFIGGFVFVIVRWFVRSKLLQFLIATTFLWTYAIAVGAEPSVARAALMFTLLVFAPLLSRRGNSLNLTSGAAIALLVWRPGDLFDPSFQLTFMSVLAIVLVALPILRTMQAVGSWRPTGVTPYPPDCSRWFKWLSETLFWSEREWRIETKRSSVRYRLFKTPVAAMLERWRVQRLLRFAVAAFVVSTGVQVMMLPLLVNYFHRISIAALFLNVFVSGLMAVLSFVALAAVALSHISGTFAAPLIALTEKLTWLMIHAVDPFTRVGLASFRLPHYIGWPASVYWLFYAPLGFLLLALTHWNPLRPVAITRIKSRVFSSRRNLIAANTFGVLVLFILLHPFSAPRPDGRFHLDFLDVGQGDAALLTMPDGTTLLVDGGGRPSFSREEDLDGDEAFERNTRSIGEGVVSEFLWARGLDRVDYIVATHADADHIDGLSDVARNFKVRAAMVARSPSADPEYRRFAETMAASSTPIEKIGAGDVLHFGSVVAEVLWPPPNNDAQAPSRNDDSLMLRIRYSNQSVLMTGDIEKSGEAAVLKARVNLHCDVVKVAHHGSKTSSTEGFVMATGATLAIISVGRTSIFGHPNQEVVDRWRANGAKVMTTGRSGTVSVLTDGKTLRVKTFVE